MRHAGCGWPNGAVSGGNGHILSLPSPDLLMLGSEHWHVVEAQNAGKRVLFRGMARPGYRPAELNWDASDYVREITRDMERLAPGTVKQFVPWNELNLQDERGDHESDHGDLTEMMTRIGRFTRDVVILLRRKYPGVELHFGAFAPKDETDYVDLWRAAAESCDVIDVHAYGHGVGIVGHVEKYQQLFPNHPINLTEWHSDFDGVEQDRDTLALLASYAAVRQDFRAYYFLWRWDGAPAHQRDLADAIAIEGNAERLALFRDPPTAQEPVPIPEPPVEEPAMPPRGIDVASYQGYPDWHAVAASGIEFAITKATEDTGYVNPTFAHNWAGIKAAGIIRGVYHFARPGVRDAVAEADYCLDVVDSFGDFEPGDLFALDLESGSGELGQWTLDFLRHAELRCGFKPLVYTGAWFSGPHNLGAYPEIGQYGLWLAAYQSEMPAPPAPWDTIAFWQYSSSGRVPGIDGDVDMNVFNGPSERIALYGKPGETPAPIPEPVPSEYAVGPGILAAMAAIGDQPASDEVYVADDWSEAFGVSGCRYVWLPATGRVHRYDPAA